MRWLVVGLVGIAGCGGTVEEVECDPAALGDLWAPIAAEGTFAPFSGLEVLAVRLGPWEADTELRSALVGQAPGWGCSEPPGLLLGAWAGPRKNEPSSLLSPSEATEGEDLGDGFSLLSVPLPSPLLVPAGQEAWIALGIQGGECGAKALGPTDGGSWRWRADTGWVEPDGRLVLGAEGCSGR